MLEVDLACARSCLSAVEANLAELRGLESWWKGLSVQKRFEFGIFEADVRAYLHQLENPDPRAGMPVAGGA